MAADLHRADTPRARPYGWIGLPLSLVAIVAGGLVLCALILGTAFLLGMLAVGRQAAVARVAGLREAMIGDAGAAEFVLLCMSILLYGAVALAVSIAARLRGGQAWHDLVGWHRWSGSGRLKLFAAMSAIVLAYSFAANALLAYLYPASQEWVKLPHGSAAVALFFVLAAVMAPLTEELIFRGWIYTALRARLGFAASLIASSALFALAHWEKTHLYALTVFPVGLALGYLRERAGTIGASMALHALFNSVAFVLLCLGG